MAGPMDRIDDAALWRRWRSAAGDGGLGGIEPDPLRLAAYAENRLEPRAAEAIEDWMAFHPELATDILAARRIAADMPPAAPEAVIARALALVAAADGQVLPFRRRTPRAPGWRVAAAWGGMAASLLVTSLVGFSMGSAAYMSVVGDSRLSAVQELLDPPIGIFNNLEEDSRI